MKEVIMQVASYSSDYPKAPIYVADLVRCKECKHWHKWSDGEMFCGCLDGGIGTDADDYCSYGEREGE